MITFGDTDDKTEVGFGEGCLGTEGASDLLLDLGDCHAFFDGVGPFLVGWWSTHNLVMNIIIYDVSQLS